MGQYDEIHDLPGDNLRSQVFLTVNYRSDGTANHRIHWTSQHPENRGCYVIEYPKEQ